MGPGWPAAEPATAGWCAGDHPAGEPAGHPGPLWHSWGGTRSARLTPAKSASGESAATWLTRAWWWLRTSLWPRFRRWLVRLWIIAIAALVLVAVLMLSEWLRYGFRDRPY